MLCPGLPENLASFNIAFGGPSTTIAQVDTSPANLPLETEDETNTIVDLVNEVVDTEVENLTSATESAEDNAGLQQEIKFFNLRYVGGFGGLSLRRFTVLVSN